MTTNKNPNQAILLFILLAMGNICFSQETYQNPPKDIADIINAPSTPYVTTSPRGEYLLIQERDAQRSIESLTRKELRLAGYRVDPDNNARSRGFYFQRVKLVDVETGEERNMTGLPDEPNISRVLWSPDRKTLAFTITENDGIYLWVAPVDTLVARQISNKRLNAAFGPTHYWMSDSSGLICLVVDPERGSPPKENIIPTGPNVQENILGAAPART